MKRTPEKEDANLKQMLKAQSLEIEKRIKVLEEKKEEDQNGNS